MNPTLTTAPVAGTPLVLRHDDAVSTGYAIEVLVCTVLLLLATYFVLRFYARRRRAAAPASESSLSRDASIRLSAQAHAHLLTVAGKKVLVTESASGVHALLVADAGEGGDASPE